jgi:L-threonine kinase
MMTIYQCPSACGELIEGQIGGVNFLSSYTIDCFSQITIEPGQISEIFEGKHSKLCAVIDLLAQAQLLPKDWRSEISLKSSSQIPVGKGLGSSTADLSAGLVAVSDYYKLGLTTADIVDYCVKVEATDHSIYTDTTLMNHVTGEVYYQTPYIFDMSVLVLEPPEMIDTRQSMQAISSHQSEARETIFKRLVEELIEAYKRRDIAWLADIAWTSALLNESVLEKPLLHTFKKLVKVDGVLGLNIAHTGSVIALWFDEARVSAQDLKKQVQALDSDHYYKQFHVYQTVPGGVRRKEGALN